MWKPILCLLSFASSEAFSPVPFKRTSIASALNAEATETDDILKPKYEIEPIPMRIGHGFDIHRMAPLEEAGQPIIIGGVVIPHTDQKVSTLISCVLPLAMPCTNFFTILQFFTIIFLT
jgi:hypothetical protein